MPQAKQDSDLTHGHPAACEQNFVVVVVVVGVVGVVGVVVVVVVIQACKSHIHVSLARQTPPKGRQYLSNGGENARHGFD